MKSRARHLLVAVAIMLGVTIAHPCQAAPPKQLKGRVVSVADGDTLTLLTQDKRQIKVRLAQIDAPEKGQPWGAKSKRALVDMVAGHEVKVDVKDIDRYGRTVGEVHAGSQYVNAELVKIGAAWAFTAYLTDPRFVEYERRARRAHLGLWAMPPGQTVAPWEWRANRRAQAETQSVRSTSKIPSSARLEACGSKHYCRQMETCAEARYFLRQCSVTSLDGDGDGVPCEKVCHGR